jgi:alkylation response protein AidB-like acyl-CoA dehydrogenase
VQEKLVRIMANTQAILLLCFRISNLIDDNKANIGQIAMAKAWISDRGREVVRLGR